MVLKYIILACVIYIVYRFYSVQAKISERKRQQLGDQEPDDPDYTDYEEVD